MKKAFTIFIGFVHDFAAGIWLAAVLSTWWLERAASSRSELAALLQELQRQLFWIGIVCIVLVFVAGAGRTFTYAYIGEVYGQESEATRRKMLIIKHVFLLTVFAIGTWWQYTLAFK